MKAVRRNLRLAKHTAAQIMQEIHGAFGVALADAPTDDCLLRSGHRNENVLVAFDVNFVAFDVLLLLADKAPSLIQLKSRCNGLSIFPKIKRLANRGGSGTSFTVRRTTDSNEPCTEYDD
jgi:hypothetical protein